MTATQTSIIREAAAILCKPGAVYELRAFGRGTTSGYFDDLDKLAEAAARLSGKVPAVYITINPVLQRLLARSVNRTKDFVKSTTSDTQIVKRHWLPIDFDVQRPADISSTDDEHEQAMNRARECRDWLTLQGWPDPLFADSGNGAHLLYYIDLPNDTDATILIMNCLKALSFRFDDETVKADTGNFNAARIWKLYGTLVCKGDSTPDRPHRVARIMEAPEWQPVQVAALKELASQVPQAQPPNHRSYQGAGEPFDLETWIARHEIEVRRQDTWNGGDRWIHQRCVWNPEQNDKSAYIVRFANGAIAAGCHHNSCQGKGWPELRELLEPGYRELRAPKPSSTGYRQDDSVLRPKIWTQNNRFLVNNLRYALLD